MLQTKGTKGQVLWRVKQLTFGDCIELKISAKNMKNNKESHIIYKLRHNPILGLHGEDVLSINRTIDKVIRAVK